MTTDGNKASSIKAKAPSLKARNFGIKAKATTSRQCLAMTINQS